MSEEHHHRSFFSFFFNRAHREEQKDPTKMRPRRPYNRDFTGGFAANEDMLSGLYHGTWAGLQFASPLAYTPIQIPINMMGLPTPHSEDKRTQAVLDEITGIMADRIPKLHRSALLHGTTWRWPRYDTAAQELVWEEIKDSSISDILLSITTGATAAILTDEAFMLSIGENQVVNVRRKRRFDLKQVAVRWSGQIPSGLNEVTARNTVGSLPLAFANDADEGEIRGHSVLSRIIRDLKDYHDIDYMRSEILTKFRPKQKQEVSDLNAWLTNNGMDADDVSSFDVAETDLIFNIFGKEKTEYDFLPEEATAPHEKALQNKFWKIFEGSGIPEMFWGGLATGNHATADIQMQQAVTYVDQLRSQWNRPYTDLYAASLRLLSTVRMENYQPFKMVWNRLESISAETKSKIFAAFAQALSQISGAAAMTKKQLWTLWKLNYPESDPGTFEEFMAGISEMAKHSSFAKAPYEMIADEDTGAAGEGGA